MTYVRRIDDDELTRLDPADRRALLGGKGSGLVAMRQLGLPVPPAVVITTDACRYSLEHDGQQPPGLLDEVLSELAGVEAALGRRLDDPDSPLLLSVRSGAAVSMPGMMDTVLNVGVTRATLPGLKGSGGEAFARDAAQRFLESYGSVVLDTKLPGAEAGTLDELGAIYAQLADGPSATRVPATGREQLEIAIDAVFRSWQSERAKTYRRIQGICEDLGTAVTIQAMVFGNRDAESGTGVAFTRDPNTGEPNLYGDFLFRAQGEDVVSGRCATLPLAALAEELPEVWASLQRIGDQLEADHRDMCDLEFTVESGTLWMLQVRAGKRAATAAVRIAVDLADEGVITRSEAVQRVSTKQLARIDQPYLDPAGDHEVLATGLGASPGVATGRIVLSADDAVESEEPPLLIRAETSPDDIHGMAVAAGILTSRGGLVSHAAVVARDLGTPAVVGASAVTIDLARQEVTIAGRTFAAGDVLTIDGTTGEMVAGTASVREPVPSDRLETLLGWADDLAPANSSTRRSGPDRLAAAHAALRDQAPTPQPVS